MRKDVKFGITIGAILFVTLAVYVMVLSRGGAQPGKSDDANKPLAEVGGTETTPATPTDAPAGGGAPRTSDTPTADPSTAVDQTSSPTVVTPPATQPTASADTKFDWNDALTKGQTSLFASAEPQRTATPAAPQNDFSPLHDRAVVNPNTPPALIDSAGTTQPSAQVDPIVPPQIAVPNIPTSLSALANGPRTHVIASGESLWTISAAVYGNSKYYTKIIAANPNLDPKHLKVGTVVAIPALGSEERSAAADSAASISTRTRKIDLATEYQVVSGDSLEKIARKLYDDSAMQGKLYDLNKSLIGPDENRLKVGWVLKLPMAPTIGRPN